MEKNFSMLRQEVAFLEERRKSKGLESLKVDFYTKFKPQNVDLGCDVVEI